MEFRADLHCHTIYSDGSLSPEEILHLAKQIQLSGISITDHDGIGAYTPDFFSLAKELGIETLIGIEISSEYKKEEVHILGYGFNPQEPCFIDFLQRMQKTRKERNEKILKKLKELHMPIEEEELFAFARRKGYVETIGRPHIAFLMVEKGYVTSFQQAFDIYLNEAGFCYVLGEHPSPREVIDVLHRSQGKAIIAHPHLLKKSILKDVLAMPFDGLEGHYGRRLPYQEKEWIDLAEKKGWIVTGGSDFHGAIRLHIPLGCSWTNEEVFRKLKGEK